MSTITLQLPPETERKLRDRADESGQTVEALVRDLVVEAAETQAPRKARFMSEPKLTREQFRKLVDRIAASTPGTPLPRDFSREDIYPDDE